MFTLVSGSSCPHCQRIMSIINSLEPLKKHMNVLTDPAKMKELNIESVPTIIDGANQRYVGSAAFTWLKNQIKSLGANPSQYGLDDVPDDDSNGSKNVVAKKLVSSLIGVAVGVIIVFAIAKLLKKGKASNVQVEDVTDEIPSLSI